MTNTVAECTIDELPAVVFAEAIAADLIGAGHQAEVVRDGHDIRINVCVVKPIERININFVVT